MVLLCSKVRQDIIIKSTKYQFNCYAIKHELLQALFSEGSSVTNIFFKIFLRWQVLILWSDWCSLLTGFQSQCGSIITCALLLPAHNDPQSQLWISRPRPVPVAHLGMVKLPLEWPPNVTSGITGRGKIRTQDLVAQSPTLYRLSYPGRFRLQILSSIIYVKSIGTINRFCRGQDLPDIRNSSVYKKVATASRQRTAPN